jgi:hypothetical protein
MILIDRVYYLIEVGNDRLPPVGYANGCQWVRAGSIEILELFGIEFINKAIYEPVQANMWVGIKVDRINKPHHDCQNLQTQPFHHP